MKYKAFKLKIEEIGSKDVLSGKGKKCDLVSLSEELDIDIPPNAKVTSLIKLIKKSEDFDEEFAKCQLEIIQEERTIAKERAIEAAKRSQMNRRKTERERI